MPGKPIRIVAVFVLAATFTLPAAALELFGRNCLKRLTDHTRVWSECQHKWTATDTRCIRLKVHMHESMQRCAARGYTKADIDAAMLEGYRTAGSGVLVEATRNGHGAHPASPWANVKREGKSIRATTPGRAGANANR